MAVIVDYFLIITVQVNTYVCLSVSIGLRPDLPELLILTISHFLATSFEFTSLFTLDFWGCKLFHSLATLD